MSNNKSYTNLTLEELLTEEKKMKRNETTSAVLIGVLIGIVLYGVAKGATGYIYILIPLVLLLGIIKNSQKQKDRLKQIQAEIDARNTKE